jgi:hypothetical protein
MQYWTLYQGQGVGSHRSESLHIQNLKIGLPKNNNSEPECFFQNSPKTKSYLDMVQATGGQSKVYKCKITLIMTAYNGTHSRD